MQIYGRVLVKMPRMDIDEDLRGGLRVLQGVVDSELLAVRPTLKKSIMTAIQIMQAVEGAAGAHIGQIVRSARRRRAARLKGS